MGRLATPTGTAGRRSGSAIGGESIPARWQAFQNGVKTR